MSRSPSLEPLSPRQGRTTGHDSYIVTGAGLDIDAPCPASHKARACS